MFERSAAIIAVLALSCGLEACSPPALAQSDTYAQNLTGSWHGQREKLHKQGIDITADYLGEVGANVTGGDRRSHSYADQFHVGATFNFAKLLGWSGSSLQVDIINRNGRLLDTKVGLGTLPPSQTLEIYGDGNVTRLFNLYWSQALWDGVVDVKIGRMGTGVAFFPYPCTFQNLAFCGDLISYISQGVNDWTLSQLGTAISFNPSKAWYLNVGAFKVNPNNNLNANGLRFFPRGHNTGTLMMAELGWHTTLPGHSGSSSLPGVWRVGGWRNTAKYLDVLSSYPGLPLDINGAPLLTGADAALTHDVSGMYVMGQQQVTQNAAGGGVSLLGAVVQADRHTDEVDQMISLLMMYKAPFAARPSDAVDFGIGRNRVSGRVATAERLMNVIGLGPVPVQGYEYIAELNYSAELYRGVMLMPNVQYIHHPGGTRDNRDATVIGLQLTITL